MTDAKMAQYAALILRLSLGIMLLAHAGLKFFTFTLTGTAGFFESIVFVHGSAGWLFSNQGGGWEYPAFLLSASVAQVLLGDGAFALRNAFKGSITMGDTNVTRAILSSMVPFK